MERHFDDELEDLKGKLVLMAAQAEESVTKALEAVLARNPALAREVEARDDLVDRLEKEVDEIVIRLLTKAPLATDLRLMTSALKVSGDLERVGDLATTMSRQAVELAREAPLEPHPDIPRMASLALGMLREAMSHLAGRDAEKAREVVLRDKEVDAMNKRVHRDLANIMAQNPSLVGACLNLMVAAKSLERVADHATNIAEEVVFLHEARDIRHSLKGAQAVAQELEKQSDTRVGGLTPADSSGEAKPAN
jgi:phosphate transport system protein